MLGPRVLLAAAAVAALAACGGEPPPKLLVGVDDDSVKWRGGPGYLFHVTDELGIDAVRVTLPWRAGQRRPGPVEHVYLRRIRRLAEHRRVVLAVYGRAADAPRTAPARAAFCAYVRNALARVPDVRDVVIWNEANSPTFWRPRRSAPADYAALLARCYDVVHANRRDANLLDSTAPGHGAAAFLTALGVAYRRSGRDRPLVDAFGHNPYPVDPTEPPTARHPEGGWVGEGDYPVLIRVLQEAFRGTAQPVPSRTRRTIWYLEDGFQTIVAPSITAYTGRETVADLVAAADQAHQLTAALRLAYCQPAVGAFFNFELVDETHLEGWQSGLLFADGRAKPSFQPFREAVADVGAGDVGC